MSVTSISYILNQQISRAISSLPAGTYSIPDDAGKLSQELLINLGLIHRTSPPPTFPPPSTTAAAAAADDDSKSDTASSDKKARTRTVSKKMKDAFLATPGKTEDDLKRVMKSYKAASDADIAAAGGDFVSFANHTLTATPPSTPPPSAAAAATKTKAKTPAAPKKEKTEKVKPRVAWSAAEKKVFKDVVESSGSVVSDDTKAEFEAFIAAKSDDDFKAFAMAGHMRAWAESKKAQPEPKAGNGEFTPAEYDLARSMQNLAVKDDAEDDADAEEDLEEIEIDGEQLLIGTQSGDIFQSTEEAGDVKIGRAGIGKFKDVKIPSV